MWRLDPEGPEAVASYRPLAPMAPASTMKLVTATSALINLGPDFRFTTRLVAGPRATRSGAVLHGPLYLKGYGDPVLATRRYARAYLSGADGNLGRLAAPLRRLGIRVVDGPIVADDGFLSRVRTGPDWRASYAWEAGPLSALSINEGWAGDTRTRYVANPPLAAARRLRATLRALGIRQRGPLRAGRAPAVARPIGAVSSPPLRTILRLMLPPSDNFIAEMLTRDVAAHAGRAGTTQAGTALAAATLGRLGAATGRERLVDGSGLSHANRLTAATLVRILAAAEEQPSWGRALIRALPQGGQGTLVHRLLERSVRLRVHAKTGYIDGVSALAGVVTSRRGERYAFAFLMSGWNVTGAHRAQDDLVDILASGAADGLPGVPQRAPERVSPRE